MTQITKEAISRAIRDPGATEGYKGERTLTEWQTDAVMRVLSTLPIAGEVPEGWQLVPKEPTEAMLDVYWRQAGESKEMRIRTHHHSRHRYDELLAAAPNPPSSPGKDGGQEVEAVVWSERENAFTDFWEQCPKLVDASDVGKARQAFMAGMDAASFFDGPATNAAIDAVANFLKERDEAVLPDEIDDDEREASARCILRVIGKASSQPASTALVERLTKALEWRLNEEGWQIADTFFGGYRVERNPHDHWCWGVFFHGGKGVGLNPADNFEAAKAAAQADFNERISSSLEAKPAPDFRDLIIVGDTAYPVHSEVCRAFNELRAALSVPAAAVVGEPVAYAREADIRALTEWGADVSLSSVPMPEYGIRMPLYAAPSGSTNHD